jgi:hypothetical protein
MPGVYSKTTFIDDESICGATLHNFGKGMLHLEVIGTDLEEEGVGSTWIHCFDFYFIIILLRD